MTHIEKDLAALRRALGLTQGELAHKAGVTRETVSKVETGAVDPQLSTLVELARAMDLEFMVVPRALRTELEAFVRAGGRWLGQPPGVDAPPSVVDLILNNK
ncbi:helix-turn-helix transcriptional regulator [Roseateles sp.]|uniref:helix-turn-helix transcriptional regulator n=1 Tax=Roseateles sp. TaxID=1971397 RepID=UPI0039E8AC77